MEYTTQLLMHFPYCNAGTLSTDLLYDDRYPLGYILVMLVERRIRLE